MKVSVCITTFNENEEKVGLLLDALKKQSLKPDEIIVIDAKDYKNCSRSEGRNIAIKKAKNKIIAITDAGCIPDRKWLEKITLPIKNSDADVVAGAYKMITRNNFEKAESVFLGVDYKKINNDFMPSARSMAFTKDIWKKAGGFPEKLKDTAEDTVFNINLINSAAKFVVTKDAVVKWYLPNSINEFAKKIYKYAKGDAESNIWWHPVKKLNTHNLKVLLIIIRYVLALLIILSGYCLVFILLVLIYCLYSFKKANVWGILLQITSDIAAIIGFSHGILQTSLKRY